PEGLHRRHDVLHDVSRTRDCRGGDVEHRVRGHEVDRPEHRAGVRGTQTIGGIVKHLLLVAALQGALAAQSIEGTWQGTLTIPGRNLEVRLAFKIARNGSAHDGRFYNLDAGRQFALGAI